MYSCILYLFILICRWLSNPLSPPKCLYCLWYGEYVSVCFQPSCRSWVFRGELECSVPVLDSKEFNRGGSILFGVMVPLTSLQVRKERARCNLAASNKSKPMIISRKSAIWDGSWSELEFFEGVVIWMVRMGGERDPKLSNLGDFLDIAHFILLSNIYHFILSPWTSWITMSRIRNRNCWSPSGLL